MPVKQAKGTPCPDPLTLDEVTSLWFERRYPQVDPEIAIERYCAWSMAGGYLYVNHLKALQNYVIREADNNKLGPMLKRVTQAAKPANSTEKEWSDLIQTGQRLKLQPPLNRSLSQYRDYIEANAKPLDVGNLLGVIRK